MLSAHDLGTKFLWTALLLLICCGGRIAGKKCPGVCSNDVGSCKEMGGQILGYCTNQLACCSVTINMTMVERTRNSTVIECGGRKEDGVKVVTFNSPNFPQYSEGDLTCTVTFPLSSDAVGVKLEFVDAFVEGLSFRHDYCEADAFHLQGFKTWRPTPICGNLTGYTVVVERWSDGKVKMEELILTALMSSLGYRWKIRITEISESDWTEHKLRQPSKDESQPNKIHVEDRRSHRTLVRPETPFIIHGEDTKMNEVPWQASLRLTISHRDHSPKKFKTSQNIKNVAHSKSPHPPTNGTTERPAHLICDPSQGHHFCGGSIIDDRHILTAAHCFHGMSKLIDMMPLERSKVVLGQVDNCLGQLSPSSVYDIETVIIHYAYDPMVFINDVAIIKLTRSIQFNENVQRIRLAEKNESFDGLPAFCSGWGKTNLTSDSAPLPNILQSSRHFVVRDQKECNKDNLAIFGGTKVNKLKFYPKYAAALQSVLCTVSGKSSHGDVYVGQGDSGGPLVVLSEDSKEKRSVQVGVVSFYYPAAAPRYDGDVMDIFMSVAHFRHWIDLAVAGSMSE